MSPETKKLSTTDYEAFFSKLATVLTTVEPALSFQVESGEKYGTDYTMRYVHNPTGLEGVYPISREYIDMHTEHPEKLIFSISEAILHCPLWKIFPNSRNGVTLL